MSLRYVSFFDGVGMFSLALERAGFVCAGACEIDKFARRVRTARLGAPDYYPEDIRGIRADDIPVADVWIGGSPCQDFSVAGKRAGLAGERSGLLRVWLDLLLARRPRWLVLENVPGMLSANEGRDFGELLATLGDGGYRWAYRVLDGQHFRVAQRRRRVFVVAHLGDGTDPAEVLFEREGGFWDPASRREKGSRAARGAAGGAGAGGEPLAPAVFVKQGRARSSLSPDGGGETWGAGPMPTFNAFENHTGTRATAVALSFYAHSGLDQAIQRDISPPLTIGSNGGRESAGSSGREGL
jgi:site-specific DNA-cytosine methylase